MYETFYGLRERPFSLLPDPDYLYLSPKHLRALTLLEYGMMNQAGFSVICGDTGAGKTTLIRRLLTDLGEDTTVGLITNTHKSFGELLSWVLMAFGIDSENRSKAQMHQLLIEYLIDQYAQNRRTVLIVDEAQNMTADTLEELRMLSNINADKDQVLQVILAGQPALRDTLRKPELMQFAQRIAVDYYLESLNRDETREYIQHRLEVAGGNPDTFTEAACHAIYRYSGGTPRLINLLCDTALVYGFAEQTHIIDAPLIEDVVREQHKNSIVPTFNKPLTGDEPREEPRSQKKPERASKPAAETQDNPVIQDQVIAQEQTVASMAQKAASDYAPAINVGHAEVQAKPVVKEPVSVSNSNHAHEHTAPNDDTHASSKVTRIKTSATPHTRADNTADSATEIKSAVKQTKTGTTQDKNSATRQTEPVTESENVNRNQFEPRKTSEDNYKEVYPIVHIADEPRKNLNIMILGFAGGVLLTAIIMIAMMWMLLRNDTPPPVAVTPPPPAQSAPGISAEDQARMEAMQKERDEAIAAAEAIKRERDAAMITAQKQEAMRAAEKRANEIIAEQERRYSQEMELVRQRALEAEVAAAKARERERIANEAAERARQEASRNAIIPVVPQPQPVTPAVPQAATTAPHVEADPKTTTIGTKAKPATSVESNGQFSANPCNSPSAKFLSTCKK